jgi:hypothetical protein
MAIPRLYTFSHDAQSRPASPLKAKELDGNFQRLRLLESLQNPPAYTLVCSDEGVRITGISGLPSPDTVQAKQFDVCENGTPVTYWMLTWPQNPL